MHKITLTQPVNLGKRLGVFEPGSYICADLNAFEIAQIAPRGAATVEHYPRTVEVLEDDVCIMRSGAWGDLLLLTPALAEFKERNPGTRVVLCCFEQHFDLFRGDKCVDGFLKYPLAFEEAGKFREIVSLENVMELSGKHATDAFADALGVTVTDYKPVFGMNPDEAVMLWAGHKTNRPVCGIQMVASVANRNYRLDQWAHVVSQLVASGWDVWLFGLKGQLPEMQKSVPHVLDLSRSDLTFSQSAAYLSACDAFVGVDSSLIHLCHALDVPAVGLYAAFPWQNRTGKNPNAFPLTGKGDCAPCNWHMHAGRQFPPNKPCSTAGYCTVLAEITPQRIVAQVNKLKP